MGLPGFLKHSPLPCRDVRRALKNLGFAEEPGRGSSHSQWSKTTVDRKWKVTLDCHNGEVKAKDVKSIISQAGVSRSEFLKAMND